MAEAHAPAVRREIAGEQPDQGRLAGAVRPDDADARAAQDAQREIADDRPLAIALAGMLRLDGDTAAGIGEARLDLHPPRHADAIGELAPEIDERTHPSFVAPPPGGNALMQPDRFAGELLLELRLLARLGFVHFLGPILELGEAAVEAPERAAIEPQHAAREMAQEGPIMA